MKGDLVMTEEMKARLIECVRGDGGVSFAEIAGLFPDETGDTLLHVRAIIAARKAPSRYARPRTHAGRSYLRAHRARNRPRTRQDTPRPLSVDAMDSMGAVSY
jgi:hypothetical protein